jgi:hypothetical protein
VNDGYIDTQKYLTRSSCPQSIETVPACWEEPIRHLGSNAVTHG